MIPVDRSWLPFLFTLVVTVSAFGPLVAVAATAQDPSLVDFVLADQFGREHTPADYPGVVVLVGSGKKGSSYNGPWIKALRDRLDPRGEPVHVVGYADLRGVPFFVKGLVRKRFPKDQNYPVLLDWKGLLAKAYGHEPKVSNIAIFGTDRRRRFQTTVTELDPERLDAIVELVESELGSGLSE